MLTLNQKKENQQLQQNNKQFPYTPPKHRKVIKVSSVNIEFKSKEESELIIGGFAKFLNSLTQTVQIICDSQIVNAGDWKLKIHDQEYYDYLKELIEKKSIVEKNFYVVVTGENENALDETTHDMIRQLKRCRLQAETIKVKEPESLPDLKPRKVKVDGWYHDTIIVEDWPYTVSPGWLNDIYNMDKNVTISMFIHPVDKESAFNYLQKRIKRISSQAIIKDENGNYSGEHDQEVVSAINMRDEINNSEGKMFFMSYYLTVKSKSLEQLNKDTKYIKTVLRSFMIKHKHALLRQDDGFRCSLPHGVDYLGELYNFTTTPLKMFFPFTSSNIVDKGGIMVGTNLLNGSLVFLNHFSYFTASMLVLGKAGTGKSFTVKAQIIKMVNQGVEVTVLDTEGEFSKLKNSKRFKNNPNFIVFKGDSDEDYESYLKYYIKKVNNSYHRMIDFKPRFLVVDEFWRFMKNPVMAEIIQDLTKSGRKRFLGICPITQEVQDLLESEYARSIINNCSIKIILNQEYNQREIIQKTFGLTNSEWSFISNADEGEGIMFAGSKHVQFKTLVSDEHYKLITTKPQDLAS